MPLAAPFHHSWEIEAIHSAVEFGWLSGGDRFGDPMGVWYAPHIVIHSPCVLVMCLKICM